MQDYLKNLNEQQLKAVTTTKPKVLVMAGAGSGKTLVLTTRIKYLIEQGVPISDICAFTFTNKAAREMKLRLQSLLRKENSYLTDVEIPTISTFHSFCYSFIKNEYFYHKLGFTNKPVVIEESDKSKIIENILTSYKDDYSNIPFVKGISKIKNKAKITEIDPKDYQVLNAVYHDYQNSLRQSNSIDYDDMIPLFLELCRIDDNFRDMIQTKYLLIDECQDTNEIQYELIKILSEGYGNVFMVGDEDQLIYSFRNSDISILKDFEITCNEIIVLNQNYRCNKDILKHANELIDYNSNRLKKELFSNIDVSHQVEFCEYSSTNEEAMEIALKIKELISSGTRPKDIAILYRNNNQSYPIEKELNNLKIPYTLFGGKPFFEYKEIKKIIYTYRLLFNPNNVIAFMEIYNQPIRGIEINEIQQFITDYKSQNMDLIRYASGYGYNSKIQDLGFELLKLQDLIECLSPSDLYTQLLEVLHYNKYLKTSNQQKPQYARIMALKEMIQDLNKNDIVESFNKMILDNVDTKSTDTVSLLTIHKAKGLEFEVVFVVGFNEGILPGYQKMGEELQEERRLGYVAITRAKQQLYLSCSVIHFINGNMAKMKPSSFLVEAGIQEAKSMDFFGNYWYNH